MVFAAMVIKAICFSLNIKTPSTSLCALDLLFTIGKCLCTSGYAGDTCRYMLSLRLPSSIVLILKFLVDANPIVAIILKARSLSAPMTALGMEHVS